MDLISLLGAALGIGLLIFIHELGHYLAARAAGVRVEVFSLGFGQRLCGFVRNGTDYRLSLFPLGGYVRVAGEDPTRREDLEDGDLYSKGFAARALFFSGGVVMNLLFALLAFPLVFRAGVEFTAPVLGSVQRGGAAWVAGLEPGDRVLSVHGKPMYSFQNMEVEIALAGGKGPVPVEVERGDGRFTTLVAPVYSESRGLYSLGVFAASAPDPILVEDVEPGSAAAEAGLRDSDRIVAIGGSRAVGDEAGRLLAAVEFGERVRLTVQRDQQELPIEFLVGAQPAATPRVGVMTSTPRVTAVRDTPEVAALDVRPADVILRVDGAPFYGDDPGVFLAAERPELELTLRRGDREFTASAALDAAARARFAESIATGPPLDRVVVVPLEGSPAARAGVRAGDRILSIDDRPMSAWADLVAAVHDAGTRPLHVVIARADGEVEMEIVPEFDEVTSLGFSATMQERRDLYRVEGFGAATNAGFVASVDLIKQLYVTMKRLFTGDVSARNLGGIVTISRVSYRAVQNGLPFFFYFLALLSINLAFINVLPIPVLDGGHLMFLLIERIKGSPVSARVLNYSQILGLVFVIALMVFVTYNDILRLL